MLIDEGDMLGELERGLYNYKPSFEILPLPEMLQPDSRWMFASALQKAVRRGQTAEAYKAALCLNRLNPEQLWFRCRTIAGEDVGIADFQVVFETLYMAGKKQWRRDRGGEEHVLAYIIEKLCKAPKTRCADDLLWICDASEDFADPREQFSGMTADELEGVIFNEISSLYEKIIAAWYLNGTAHHRPAGMVLKKGNPKHLLDIFRHVGMPCYAYNTIRLALTRTSGYGVSMAFAYEVLSASKTYDLVAECPEPSQKIGHWNAEAWDRHCRPGRAALRKFLELCPEVSDFIRKHRPGENPVNVLGMTTFAIEGQLLDKRLLFDGSEQIRRMVLEAWLPKMAQEARSDLLAMVRQRMDRLNEARCLIWDSMATLTLGCKR